MDKEMIEGIAGSRHLGCFGDFDITDPICKQFCALNLRCAIESDQNARMEILEDLISPDGMYTTEH